MIARLRPALGWQELYAAWTPARSDEVARYEAAFAALMGQKHAIAFPYGRTGLTLLLEALGLKGREVVCPAYTCVVVPHAIVTSGNEPVFVDSQASDFNMDWERVPEAITEQTGAIVATSIFGYPTDLGRLARLRERHPGLPVIQDCAHSFAAEWRGRPVQQAGDAAIFGLNISKLIHSVFGGMVTTDRDDLAERLRALREARIQRPDWLKAWRRRLYLAAVYPTFAPPIYGLINRLERSGALNAFVKYYDESLIDMPADYLIGMTGAEAKVGQVQLTRYARVVAHRRRIAALYDAGLRDLPDFRLPPLVEGATYSHYVPRTSRRQELLAHGLRHGVQFGQLIEYSVPEMASYRDRPGSRLACPVAGEMARTSVNLPVHMGVSEADARRVIEVVRALWRS